MDISVGINTLHDIVGRQKYITDPERQEYIVWHYSTVSDWKPYVAFEKVNKKSSRENNQGREFIVGLPYKLLKLLPEREKEFMDITKKIAVLTIGKNTDYEFVIHFNEKGKFNKKKNAVNEKDNLHMHIIFSQRNKIINPTGKSWDRDVYLKNDGNIARAKKDRAKDENGNELPPIHKKGDPKITEFSAKDKIYNQRNYIQKIMKPKLRDYFNSLELFEFELKQKERWEIKNIKVGAGINREVREKFNNAANEFNEKGYKLKEFENYSDDDLILARKTALTKMYDDLNKHSVKSKTYERKTKMREIIFACIKEAKNYDDFISYLKNSGLMIRRNKEKTLFIKFSEDKKFTNVTQLGAEFCIRRIQAKIRRYN